MPTITLTLPKPHKAQRDILSQLTRFNVADCGRRFGKTTIGSNLTTPALKGYPVGWFSPTYKMLLEVWRDISFLYQPLAKRTNQQERRIELITGGVIEMWSLDDPNAGRGRKYKRVIVDEAAMVAKLQEAWQAAIRPTLADLEGDAFFFSTPKGHNFFKTLFDWGKDPMRPDWSSWQLPTSANPYIKASEIEAARLELPERIFRQEYLAEFIEDSGIFRNVIECATANETIETGRYTIGVDWAKHNDFTVITVMDIENRAMVAFDRFNQIDYTLQIGRLKAICERYKPQSIIAESNSMGEPIIEQLQREGLPVCPFQTTNASKANIIDALSLAFEQNDIRILNEPVLISELQAYEATRLPSGMLRYSAPEGYHDDCVMSLALALYGVNVNLAPSGFTTDDIDLDIYKSERRSVWRR